MPRSPALPPPPASLRGSGLATVLSTDSFEPWEAAVAANLGHHRSELLSPRVPFAARLRLGGLGGFTVLHLSGRGRLRLTREQCGRGVLWLPLRGMSQERINGGEWLAEPGTGLLFQPGDALDGDTSEELEGLSILLPEGLEPLSPGCSPLLAAGVTQQRLLAAGRQLAQATAQQPPGAAHAADAFAEALRAWGGAQRGPQVRERITARRRRDTVAQACRWIEARLAERFRLADLSEALEVSPRQLQYSFQEELGRSPMAEAKRRRLRRLRTLLLDPGQADRSVAELMAAAGLVASGVTAADYRRWCGESPSRTRRR